MISSSTENALSPELAELDAEGERLSAQRQPIDPNAPAVAEEAPVDYLGDAKDIIEFCAESLATLYPSTAKVLTVEKTEKLSRLAAKLMEKRQISAAFLFGEYKEEAALTFAVVALVPPLYAAIAHDRAELKALESGQPAPAVVDKSAPMQPVVDRTEPTSLHLKA